VIYNAAGTTSIVVAPTVTELTETLTGAVVVQANNANDTLEVQVTPTSASITRWMCRLKMTKVDLS
jgi:hypothetical protein